MADQWGTGLVNRKTVDDGKTKTNSGNVFMMFNFIYCTSELLIEISLKIVRMTFHKNHYYLYL
jgi:hypothetical protein